MTPPALLELRRYRLHPGTRDALTRVFADELTHTQEAVGLQVIGPYADPAQPDHFVWLRGFASEDPAARGAALAAFYGGPAWATHKDTANATMVAFDDVHLLRPVTGGEVPAGPLDVRVWPADAALPVEELAGALVLVSAELENTFPALPVHTERVVAALAPAGALDGVAAPHAATLEPLS